MKLSILIPFRDADGTRMPGKDWVVARWQAEYPDAEIVLAPDDGLEPFNKSMAVNTAFDKSHGDIIVILDADTWIEPDSFRAAVRMIVNGEAPWVIPATVSWRLTEQKTHEVLARNPTAPLPSIALADIEQVSYVIGFCHILPREAFLTVGGMDERFRGWGGEDGAFIRSVDAIWGHHLKLKSTLVSLWHARPRDGVGRRKWVGQIGRSTNTALWRRYTDAWETGKMFAILRERGGPLNLRSWHNAERRRSRNMGRVIFGCTMYPALMVRLGDHKFKFVGGRLAVPSNLALEVQAFANKRPEYGIAVIFVDEAPKTVGVVEPVMNEPVSDEPTSDGYTAPMASITSAKLREALRAMGYPTSGNKTALLARYDEALAAYR